jgi:lysylphosphatidylglycerol synthetase-like protein (DUF2156 family)
METITKSEIIAYLVAIIILLLIIIFSLLRRLAKYQDAMDQIKDIASSMEPKQLQMPDPRAPIEWHIKR